MANEIIIGQYDEYTFTLATVDSKFEIRIKDDEGDIDPTPALRFGKTVHDYVDADEDRTILDYDWMYRDYLQAQRIQDAIRAWENEHEGHTIEKVDELFSEQWDVQDECEKMIRLWNQHSIVAGNRNARHDI